MNNKNKLCMKYMVLYTQSEKVKIVVDIVNKLKTFPTVNGGTINLYNDQYTYLEKWKEICQTYIKTDKAMQGTIIFEEIWKKIEYVLPINKGDESLFVMRKMEYSR